MMLIQERASVSINAKYALLRMGPALHRSKMRATFNYALMNPGIVSSEIPTIVVMLTLGIQKGDQRQDDCCPGPDS